MALSVGFINSNGGDRVFPSTATNRKWAWLKVTLRFLLEEWMPARRSSGIGAGGHDDSGG